MLPNGCCCFNDKEIISFSESASHRHLQRSLDWTGRPMAWTPRSADITPMDFFQWDHIKALIYTSPVDSEEDLIAPILLRQQQPSGSNVAFLRAQVTLCCYVVSCLARTVAALLNICSKLVRNTFFFSEYSSSSAWFPTSVRPNLTVRSAARTHLGHIVPWQ